MRTINGLDTTQHRAIINNAAKKLMFENDRQFIAEHAEQIEQSIDAVYPSGNFPLTERVLIKEIFNTRIAHHTN